MRKPAWQSRKLWVSVIGPIAVLVNEIWGISLPVEVLATIAVILVTYVAAESYIDSKK